jgi:hypothetical protein
MQANTESAKPTTQTALAEFLEALGFKTMAAECRIESRREYLSKYARIILRNAERNGWPYDKRLKMANSFRLLGLI